jgi:predicted peptidase
MRLAPYIGLVWVTCALTSLDTGFLDRSIPFRGASHRYQVYVPFEFTESKTWPIIVDLHGNTLQGQDGLLHTAVGIANQIRRTRSRFPVIVLLPQAPEGGRWEESVHQELVIAQLDRTIAEFHGDPNRVYLAGDSMGGTGALRVAYRWPDRFAALAIVAGRIQARDSTAGAADRAANPFVAAPDPFLALAKRVQKLPIRLFHGTADERNAVDESRRLVAALKAVDGVVNYVEYPGLGHIDGIEKAYAESDFVDWLLTHRRRN